MFLIVLISKQAKTKSNTGAFCYQNPESKELPQVLKKVSMEDRTVILTFIVNEAWTSPGSVLELFLESFWLGQGTKRLLNHLLIITVGSTTFQHCNSLHPHCFQLTQPRSINYLLLDVLKLGYSYVFTVGSSNSFVIINL